MLPFSTAAAAGGDNDDGEVDCVSGTERWSAVGKLLLESMPGFGLRGAATGAGRFLTTKQNTTTTRQEIWNLETKRGSRIRHIHRRI